MNYKWIFLLVLTTVFLVNPESFVVKKVKQVVVPIKDQCLERVGTCVENNSHLITTLGKFMEEYGLVQQEWMALLKDELEGTEHPLFQETSQQQLKKINDATAAMSKKVAEMEKVMAQLTKELREYRELLCLAK